MPSYIESALYDFVKTIMTRGIRTLKSPRFFPYSAFLLLIVTVTTFTTFIDQVPGRDVSSNTRDLLLYVELSASVVFIFVGLFLGRIQTSIQVVILVGGSAILGFLFYNGTISDNENLAITIAAILYIAWIAIVSFSTFSLFRDLFANETVGTVLFLGKPEDDGKVMFSVLAWLLVIINITLGYLIYDNANGVTGIELSGVGIILLALLATLPLLGFQRKHDVFYTVLSCFFMFTTIKIFLFTFKVLTGSQETSSLWDIIFSLFMALYTIQNAAVKGINIGKKLDDDDDDNQKKKEQSLEEKLMEEEKGALSKFLTYALTDRGIVLVILGIVLGYHTMQIQTILGRENLFNDFSLTRDADIVILGYEVNLFITIFIYIISLILFFIFPPFRNYANPKVNRIEWLPPYEELRDVFSKIKSGEISWKMDITKLVVGMGKDMLAEKLGRKKKKSGEERFNSFWGKLRGGDK